jgi:putative acetyltransferase
MKHMADLGLMVARDYWNVGIGFALMQAALEIADNWLGLKRVELGVYTVNEAAIHLYEKCGFESEGVRRRWAFGDGGWFDSLLMARLHNVDGEHAPAGSATSMPQRPARRADAGKVIIRPPAQEDVEDLFQLMGHPLVARTTLQMPSQEIQLTERRVSELRPGLYRFVADIDGRVVGSASLYQDSNPRRSHAAGLGMGVHPDYWGQGIGSALMSALMDLADNWLNISRVELDVNVDNPGGVRLYEKFGFKIEGTRRYHAYGDGRWADSYFMARLKD